MVIALPAMTRQGFAQWNKLSQGPKNPYLNMLYREQIRPAVCIEKSRSTDLLYVVLLSHKKCTNCEI